MSAVLWIWLFTFRSDIINLFLNWHQNSFSLICHLFYMCTHTKTQGFSFPLTKELRCTWIRTAICCSLCTLQQSGVDVWWLCHWVELFDKKQAATRCGFILRKSPWFPCTQLDVFTHTGLVWHGQWRRSRPLSAHKHSTTLPALCTAGRDDTRGTGLYWVLLRLLCKSGQCSGKAQLAGQQSSPMEHRPLGRCWGSLWASMLCETWPPLSSNHIKLTKLSVKGAGDPLTLEFSVWGFKKFSKIYFFNIYTQ